MITFLGVELELLDCVYLLPWVQPLGAGVCAVLDVVAPVQLELVVDGVQSFFGELITAVLYPPGKIVDVYGTQSTRWYDKHVYISTMSSKTNRGSL
jgi:hypothetical protein